jgi:hypothetical protein
MASDWAGLTWVVIVLGAYVAWRQVNEAREAREERTRPFVIIDFHPWSSIIELVITNVGSTLARDVRFNFTPRLETTHDEQGGRGKIADLNVFQKGIPALAPGREIKMFFDQFPARLEAGLPMTYAVRVSYSDPKGKPLAEETVLDLEAYVGTGGITRRGLHDIHRQLEEIAKSVKRWTDWDGLKVLTREDRGRRRDELDARDAHHDDSPA